MIRKVSTKDMTKEEWRAERRKAIGGSDAGVVLGLSPYSSPYALWAEKSGKMIPDDIGDNEAVRLGNDLEQYVAQRWMEKTGKKLRRENNILYNDAYPFAHANIDRAVVGETDAGFEAKTTSSLDVIHRLESGQIPDTWYCQITHYMMVTGARRWYLGALAFGRGFYSFEFTRNEEEITALANAEMHFWSLVQSDTPPEVDGSGHTIDALKKVFPESCSGVCDLTNVGTHVAMYRAIDQQIKELEEQKAEHQAAIMEYMGETELGVVGDVKVSWKTQTRSTFDRKAWEAEHGAIPEKYTKVSTSRVFKITTKKR